MAHRGPSLTLARQVFAQDIHSARVELSILDRMSFTRRSKLGGSGTGVVNLGADQR
jgi:hypothetical protein